MTITETRKKALARRFGTECKVTDYSWVSAMDDDVNGTFTLYLDDMTWLLAAKGTEVANCDVTTPPVKTGINFSTGEVIADIYLDGIKIGQTNRFIETGAGTKTFEIRKTGYTTRTVTETITEGSIVNRSYTLYTTTTVTTQQIEGENGVPLSVEIVMEGGKPVTSKPLEVDVGTEQWYGIMVKNNEETTWYGYTGVKFTDVNNKSWSKMPDKQYAQPVLAGATKSIKTAATIPMGEITEGNVNIAMLLRGFRK